MVASLSNGQNVSFKEPCLILTHTRTFLFLSLSLQQARVGDHGDPWGVDVHGRLRARPGLHIPNVVVAARLRQPVQLNENGAFVEQKRAKQALSSKPCGMMPKGFVDKGPLTIYHRMAVRETKGKLAKESFNRPGYTDPPTPLPCSQSEGPHTPRRACRRRR